MRILALFRGKRPGADRQEAARRQQAWAEFKRMENSETILQDLVERFHAPEAGDRSHATLAYIEGMRHVVNYIVATHDNGYNTRQGSE